MRLPLRHRALYALGAIVLHHGVTNLHLSGRNVDMSAHDAEYRRHITPAIRHADADSPHSGVVETSVLFYLRPDLISPTYPALRSRRRS